MTNLLVQAHASAGFGDVGLLFSLQSRLCNCTISDTTSTTSPHRPKHWDKLGGKWVFGAKAAFGGFGHRTEFRMAETEERGKVLQNMRAQLLRRLIVETRSALRWALNHKEYADFLSTAPLLRTHQILERSPWRLVCPILHQLPMAATGHQGQKYASDQRWRQDLQHDKLFAGAAPFLHVRHYRHFSR